MANNKPSERPAFSAPLYAALRQGSKEFSQALQALPSSIRTVEEPGTLGNPTPQMVTEQAQGHSSFQDFLDRYDSRASEREQTRDMER
ncbi:MAG TPA: hypothetical protein VGN12_06820 [Pirellulales bacterium]|jgi:hypothetical protein